MTNSQGEDLRFFATTQYSRQQLRGTSSVRLPTSAVHAKEMGTKHTLCGRRCDSWVKFWGQPFHEIDGERCSQCIALVERATGHSVRTRRRPTQPVEGDKG